MTTTRDFPRVDLSLLTDREALILQLRYADGWSLRRIARGVKVDEKSVRRSHKRALDILFANSRLTTTTNVRTVTVKDEGTT